MSEFEVLVLGGVGVDTIVRVPQLAVPPGDAMAVPPVRDYVAHSDNGVALGFHALGLRTKFIDFPFYDGRHPHDLKLPQDFYLPLLERAGHVHIAADRAFGAFADAHRLGVSTSTDVHAWDGVHPWALGSAREADLVFLSAAGAPDRIDDIMHGILDAGRATVVVATEGANGCRVLTRVEPTVRRFPVAAPERPVVDSNGAGDAFSTAFMSRWFAGRPVEECALAGAVSGAFACEAPGTHEELISADELAAAAARAAATEQWQAGRG